MQRSFLTNILDALGGRLAANCPGKGYPGMAVSVSSDYHASFDAYGGVPGGVTSISSAQMLALRATPVEVLPSPGPGYAVVPVRWQIFKAAGTAYTLASDNDLVLRYTNSSGAVASPSIEGTGFIDQTTAQMRLAGDIAGGAGPVSFAPTADAKLMLHMLGAAEVTGGNATFFVHVNYIIVPVAL